jgi:glycosyltransferase involved in cell wall biosynthesis
MKLAILDSLRGLSLADWIVAGGFLFIFLIRFYYLLFFFGRMLFTRKREVVANETSVQPVTVFLTVRNEEDNLRRLLPQLLSINEAKYDVVVVDDYSLDNTYAVLGSFKKHPNFHFSSLNEETRFSVKLAQNIALKAAKNDWVLTLPVDTVEVHRDWIGGFAGKTSTENRNLLLGYTGFEVHPGFYNKMCRAESFWQYTRSAGFVANGISFVYSEDNVAFRKEEYFRLGGYGLKTREAYANLELIINEFIRRKHTVVMFNAQTRITRSMETNRNEFYNLINRSFRIEKYLPAWKRTVLQLETFTNVVYTPFLLLMIVLYFDLWLVWTVLGTLKIVTQTVLFKIILKRLNERKIFITSLLYGWLMPYFKMVYRWFFSQPGKRSKWRKMV